jgi:MFS family permease
MDNAARARQRILALFLTLTAVLYIGAEGLTPKGLDQVVQTRATAFRVLPIAAKHPAQLYVAGSLALLALGGLAVSYAAIAALVRNRGSAVATVAALIGGIGAFCGAIVNVLVFPNLAAAATAHLSGGAAARFLVTTFNSGFGHVFLYAYFIGIYAAPALMGFALWRSRSVPRWLAVLFFIGLEVAQQQISAGIVVVLYMLPFAVAMVLLAARIWQAATQPASHHQEPAVVPMTSI